VLSVKLPLSNGRQQQRWPWQGAHRVARASAVAEVTQLGEVMNETSELEACVVLRLSHQVGVS